MVDRNRDEEQQQDTGVETPAGIANEGKDGTIEIFLEDGPDPEHMFENEDGSVDIILEDVEQENEEIADFYKNLIPDLAVDGRQLLDDLVLDLCEKIESDIEARKPRDEKYAEGIKRTGLGDEAPGGASFQGASRAVHPMITKAAVDFQARAMKEVYPANGPVKAHIVGTITKRRQEKAERVARCMNWQLQYQITEFRNILERGQMQASINGASFIHFVPRDPIKRRTATGLLNIDKVIIAASANDFYGAERITIIDDITQLEFDTRIADGIYYEDLASNAPNMVPDKTKAEKARDKVEGKDETTKNIDGERRIYIVNTYLTGIEEALESEYPSGYLPYLVYIDEQNLKVLGLVRNWEEDDGDYQRMHWLTEIPFVPWEESNIGLVHLIGGLSAGATGSLRALLDSAHVNNIPTAAYLKGSSLSGQSKSLSPTQLVEITASVGADDIRKVLMPIPYNEPSTVLYQLMTFLVDSAEGVVRTTFEKLSENNSNLPVGTTYALIEQGLTVVSAIMARQHYAMHKAFEVLYRINRMYLDNKEIKNEAGETLAYRSDFTGPMDIIPVSDPNVPSDAHRFAQTQALAQRADAKPDLYNARAVEMAVLQRMKIASPEQYLKAEQKVTEMNAVNENFAATLGRPIAAFPEQDHISHLQAHLEFLQSPFFGFLSIIAPTFIPIMLEHIKEHLGYWYVTKMFEGLSTSIEAVSGPLAMVGKGMDINSFMKMGDPGVSSGIDELIATVSPDVLSTQGGDAEELLQLQIIQVVQRAQAELAKYQDDLPMDPNARAQVQNKQLEVQQRREATQQQAQLKVADINARREQSQLTAAQQAAKDKAAGATTLAKEEGQDRRTAVQEAGDQQRAELKATTDLIINREDNTTALQIAEAELESAHKIAVSTGGDSSPGA